LWQKRLITIPVLLQAIAIEGATTLHYPFAVQKSSNNSLTPLTKLNNPRFTEFDVKIDSKKNI